MRFRIVPAALAGLALCTPGALAAQTPTVATTVTFVVPVDLTQLSPDLQKVRLACAVSSPALVVPSGFGPAPTAEDEIAVQSGQVVTTLRVVIPILSSWLQDPVGKRADYGCHLEGLSKSNPQWNVFADNAADPAFRLKPTPANLFGSFVW
jgi:hypothetical protein